MQIGILGTGNMGGGLGKLFAQAGHKVMFGSRESAKAGELAKSVGSGATGGGVKDAAAFGEAVLLAVPWGAVEETLAAAGSLDGKILIDCTNPLTPDYMQLVVGFTTSAAEETAQRAPGARVVKAFNHIYAQIVHSSPVFNGQKATVFYCGDDAGAKTMVGELIDAIGFESVDSGPLRNARLIEPVAGLCIQLAYAVGMGTDQALKLVRR